MASNWTYGTSEPGKTQNQLMVTSDGVISPVQLFNPDWLTDYTDVVPIGEGGMGLIFKGRNTRLNRWEAIKVGQAGRMMTAKEVARFRFEAEATAGLSHPNIVQVYGSGEIGGLPYLALQYIPGGTLIDLWPKLRDQPRAAAALLAKIARAVAHAHESGILHRDLKPANVLIDTDGEPHVTDFGLAKRFDAQDMNLSIGVVGTPAYMAPEQARGEARLTTATDIFALGAMLYEYLTGRTPFQGKSVPEIFLKLTTEPPVAPRVLVPTADPDLEAICLKCLEKNPADRYANATELAEEFERVAHGLTVNARNPGIIDWLRQALNVEPEAHQAYAWPVLVWFAAILFTLHMAVFAVCQLDLTSGWLWLCHGGGSAACSIVIYYYLVRRFHLLPRTEKHSMMLAVGHVLVNLVLLAAYVPWSLAGPVQPSLAMYPSLYVASGYGIFILGTTHMGRFYLIGMVILAKVPFIVLLPHLAPPLYGTLLAVVMLYWAYCLRVVYRK